MLHASRLFKEAVNGDGLLSELNDGRISEDKLWQRKCKIAKHVICNDKVKAEKSIRDLYRVVADEMSKNHNIKLFTYDVTLSRPQIEQTIENVIYDLVKKLTMHHLHINRHRTAIRYSYSLLCLAKINLSCADKKSKTSIACSGLLRYGK